MNRFSIYSYKRDCFYPTKTKFVDTGQWRFDKRKKEEERKKKETEKENSKFEIEGTDKGRGRDQNVRIT